MAVKQFLMNGGIVTGVGNIYASEALFHAGIHPARSAGRISAARWERLAHAVRATLESALSSGRQHAARFRLRRREPGPFPAPALGLRPRRQALPRLQDADPRAAPGPALDLLLPALPAMSATGAWTPAAQPSRRASPRLRQWRDATSESLAAFRRWAVVGRLIDEQAAARLAHLERRLAFERLTIAFVGEHSRGKSELINALFFADLGARLLPSAHGRAIQCPTEILWDPARAQAFDPAAAHRDAREPARAARIFRRGLEEWNEVAARPAASRDARLRVRRAARFDRRAARRAGATR